jgi:hypothetical protein
MPDFKLISADSHINESPAAWERVQKQYGNKAPKVVINPPGVAKGTWLVMEGLPPIGCSHYSLGMVVSKERGISEVDAARYAETIQFMAQLAFSLYATSASGRIDVHERQSRGSPD